MLRHIAFFYNFVTEKLLFGKMEASRACNFLQELDRRKEKFKEKRYDI